MYSELILFIIIFVTIYFLFFNDSRIDYLADNGLTYKIKNEGSDEIKKKKANILSRLDEKAKKIVKHMYDNKLPIEDIAIKTYNRFSNSKIGETPHGDKSAAYTQNKGNIFICLLTNNKFNDENDAFFVILHELAHVMSDSYGHGDEFKKNFDFIVKLAVKLDLWKPKKYEEDNTDYCGVVVTSSPCMGDTCSKDNLDHFYKESLLDYK